MIGEKADHHEALLAQPNLDDRMCADILRRQRNTPERELAAQTRLPWLVCQIVAKSNLGQTEHLSALCQRALDLVSPDTSQLVMLHLLRALADHEIRAQSSVGANALAKFETVVRKSQYPEFLYDARLLNLLVHMGDRSKHFVENELEICARYFKDNRLWLRYAKTCNSQLMHLEEHPQEEQRKLAMSALRASRRGGHNHHYALTLLNIVDIYLESNQLDAAHRLLNSTAQFIRSTKIPRNTIAFALFCCNRALWLVKSGHQAKYQHQYRKSITLAKRLECNLLTIMMYQELADGAKTFGDMALQSQVLQEQIEFHKALARSRMDQAQRAAQLDDRVESLEDIQAPPPTPINLINQAQIDELTQLPTRAVLDERLRSITTSNQATVFAFIDLNNFKEINDSMSHYAGDSALQVFASRLSKALAHIGTVYRWGGDEFFFVSDPNTDSELVRQTLDNCAVIKGSDWTHDGVTVPLTARVGTVQYPNEAKTAATVMRFAALTLQAAKHTTHKILHFKSELREQFERSIRLKRHLATMDIETNITVEFQSIYHMKNLTQMGCEVLARWNYEGEKISPSEFIPLLMALNREHELLRSVLNKSIEQLKRHPNRNTFCAINVSPTLFCQQDFADMLLRDLNHHPAWIRKSLVLEIVESETLGTRQSAAENAAQLQAAGLRLAIDDFGAGFSTMEQLANLPFDIIKIDKGFINTLTDGSIKQTILKSMIQLAKDTQKIVIVEGIETQQQLDIVSQLNADCGQGYYFSGER
ncbi:MAG: bifunctional diguanylate cyclase/phosphodiesterase [Gammaproteobacteria bacterium]|nr:bifunctional diguanylate cyclase/phosphodiesterase [Gammaproteobacteria bacterium]